MIRVFTDELVRRARIAGLSSPDIPLIAVAILTSWSEQPATLNGRSAFAGLADQIPSGDMNDGTTIAREWLRDPGLSHSEWTFVDEGLQYLHATVKGQIDWDAELAYNLHSDQNRSFQLPSMSTGKSIANTLDFPSFSSVACLFSGAAPIAWALAEDHDVTLHADFAIAMMMVLFSRSAGRAIKVRRDNPVDGTALPVSISSTDIDRDPTLGIVDHIVSVPPMGLRIQQGAHKGLSFESHQLLKLIRYARHTFNMLMPDGALFRESKAEMTSRATVVAGYDVTVLSLPAGIFWPSTGISTSLLRAERKTTSSTILIDARTMEKSSTGRVQEGLIDQHLEKFRGFHADQNDHAIAVEIDELEANGYSLLPERYVKSAKLLAMQDALDQRPVITLADVATIERGKAPTPLHDLNGVPALVAWEIAPADILNGIVQSPRKSRGFDKGEAVRIDGVTVKLDDILVSIKGNVGSVGIVGTDVLVAELQREPWIVSQSLAIIRLKPNPYISSPEILSALLTAPWVREKLESMSGASTVRTLPISALRMFQLPVPTAEEMERAVVQLADIATMREQIVNYQQNLAGYQKRLWTQLWQMPTNFGEE